MVIEALNLQVGDVFTYTGAFTYYRVSEDDAYSDLSYPGRVLIKAIKTTNGYGILIRLPERQRCTLYESKS